MSSIKFDDVSVQKLPKFASEKIEYFYQQKIGHDWGGRHLFKGRVPDKASVQLFTNDYLSLSRHPEILKALSEALQNESEYNSLMMSAVYQQADNVQSQVESQFAQFIGTEASVICQSGWCANTGLIQSLADESTPVYIDMFAHMSLWEGINSVRATPRPFRHNSEGHLERQIQKFGVGIIVVDAVYSTTGNVAPLREIADIAIRYGCILIVDESHSLGTHGPNGRGLIVEYELLDKVHFMTASLAKAFVSRAGVITCSTRFSEYFRMHSLPAIFSSALLQFEILGLSRTIEFVSNSDQRRKKLFENVAFLRRGLSELGYNVSGGTEQIIALESGSEKNTLVLKDALEERGVFGAVFCAPATPEKHSLIRFSVQSDLKQSELKHVIQVCADIADKVDLLNWPSTRKNKSQ